MTDLVFEKSLLEINNMVMSINDSLLADKTNLYCVIRANNIVSLMSEVICLERKDQMKNFDSVMFGKAPIALLCRELGDYLPPHISKGFITFRELRNCLVHAKLEPNIDIFIDIFNIFHVLINWYLNEHKSPESSKEDIELTKSIKTNSLRILDTLYDSSEPKVQQKEFGKTPEESLRGKDAELEKLKAEYDKLSKEHEELTNKYNSLREDYLKSTIEDSSNKLLAAIAKLSEKTDEIVEYGKISAENTEEIKQRLDLILDKLVALESSLAKEKSKILEALKKAEQSGNDSETEKIISSFSESVTELILNKIDTKNINNDYELEKAFLINTFGEDMWSKLSEPSKEYLITAKVIYRNMILKNDLDYSGVCLLLTKAVDSELHIRLFKNYKEYLNKKYNSTNNWPDFFFNDKGRLLKENEFSLGSVAFFCCYRTHKGSSLKYDKEEIVDYAMNGLFGHCNNEADALNKLSFIAKSAETIRNEYRNPAAHTTPMSKIKADECLAFIIDITKVLVKLMQLFK